MNNLENLENLEIGNLEGCELINLTPHNLNLLNNENEIILVSQSQGSLRLETEIQKKGFINGIMITKTIFKDVYFEPNSKETKIKFGEDKLPEKKENRFYIVSLPVAQYAKQKGRKDFLIPGNIVKSEDRSQILGMRSLAIL